MPGKFHACPHCEGLKDQAKAMKAEIARLKKEVNFDPLTKLLNKTAFREMGKKLFALSRRNGTPITALYVDLNDFKEINDTYGHQIGDEVIRMVADILKMSFRTSDIIGRDGGDEFAAILPNTSSRDAEVVVEKIKKYLAGYRVDIEYFGRVSVTAAIGIVEATIEMDGLEDLLTAVDRKMYEIKHAMKA